MRGLMMRAKVSRDYEDSDPSCGQGRRPTGVPFLKWAGGKQWLAQALAKELGNLRGSYYEPFVGGGSVFFALAPTSAVLSDVNDELMRTYRIVQELPKQLIARLRRFRFTSDDYYRIRASRPRTPIGEAARFIYLNRTCWNGLFRVNRNGEFNVPPGKFKYDPDFVGASRILSAHRALREAFLRTGDFEVIAENAVKGDLVYLDPPYSVMHSSNGFLRYNEGIFSWEDQKRLAGFARRLSKRGVRVVVSNAAHSSIKELYRGFDCRLIHRRSLLAADCAKRQPVTECLFLSISS